MVLERSCRITFSQTSALLAGRAVDAGSKTNPAVFRVALWQVTQYLPSAADAWLESGGDAAFWVRPRGLNSVAATTIDTASTLILDHFPRVRTDSIIYCMQAPCREGV